MSRLDLVAHRKIEAEASYPNRVAVFIDTENVPLKQALQGSCGQRSVWIRPFPPLNQPLKRFDQENSGAARWIKNLQVPLGSIPGQNTVQNKIHHVRWGVVDAVL